VPILIVGVRIFLGIVLLITGAFKVKDLKRFAAVVRTYKMLPEILIKPSSYGLVIAEIVLGVLLIAGFYVKHANLAAAFLQFGMMAFIANALLKHKKMEDCGCFGVAIKMPVTWWHVAINAVFIIKALFVFSYY